MPGVRGWRYYKSLDGAQCFDRAHEGKVAREVHTAMVQAKAAIDAEAASKPVDGEVLPAEAAPSGPTPVAAMPSLKDAPAPVKAYVETVRKLRAEVEANSEDVGKRFADEARKMHHGEVEERPIRGEASLEDAAALDEEGIDVFVIPPCRKTGTDRAEGELTGAVLAAFRAIRNQTTFA